MTHKPSIDVKFICGDAHPELGRKLAAELNLPLTVAEVTNFADGETRIYIEGDLQGTTVCILQPTCTPVNENLMKLALLIDAARAAGATRVIGLVPYFGYARQDRRERSGEPRSAQVAAKLLATVGLDHLVVIDLHTSSLESAFPFPITMLSADDLFWQAIRSWDLKRPVVVSPDAGGIKRAQRFAARLEAPLAIVTKRRPSADFAVSSGVLGDVCDRTCIIVDDMASTGRTLAGAAESLATAGASDIHAVFTHAVMAPGAMQRLATSPIMRLLTSDSIPVAQHERLDIVATAPLMAQTLRQLCKSLAASGSAVLARDCSRTNHDWDLQPIPHATGL